jgi:hypothetical protein
MLNPSGSVFATGIISQTLEVLKRYLNPFEPGRLWFLSAVLIRRYQQILTNTPCVQVCEITTCSF